MSGCSSLAVVQSLVDDVQEPLQLRQTVVTRLVAGQGELQEFSHLTQLGGERGEGQGRLLYGDGGRGGIGVGIPLS